MINRELYGQSIKRAKSKATEYILRGGLTIGAMTGTIIASPVRQEPQPTALPESVIRACPEGTHMTKIDGTFYCLQVYPTPTATDYEAERIAGENYCVTEEATGLLLDPQERTEVLSELREFRDNLVEENPIVGRTLVDLYYGTSSRVMVYIHQNKQNEEVASLLFYPFVSALAQMAGDTLDYQ